MHGFADVTGVAADLLVVLVRVFKGTVILDRPPDPAFPGRDDLGRAYLTRLEERMAHLDSETDAGADEAPEIGLAEAPDAEAEARWVAERIRDLLDRGIQAEEVGVVGRTLELMALPLRRHFHRLGVPFSGAQPFEAFQQQFEYYLAGGEPPSLEVPPDSFRSLGEPDAPVVVTEFSDYQ